jgi:DNA helicase II / ATP-dependent DNA helicase PcrA
MNNKLIIAGAGSGKTTYLVNEALNISDGKILILTYTEANELEIRDKILKKKRYIPSNLTLQTWFSFLLQHGVRPYQGLMHDALYETDIGFLLTSTKSGKKYERTENSASNNGHPVYWGESECERHYFTSDRKIYSDKISKFVCKCNLAAKGDVIDRICRIFKYIYIDEVQDLAGYDLEILKFLFKATSSITLVGDPRQVTYLTHNELKYSKYSDGKINEFILSELGKSIKCEIDGKTLSTSHRNNSVICKYSSRLYTEYPEVSPCSCPECRTTITDHEGVFIVNVRDVDSYLKRYNAVQLRWSSTTKCNPQYPVMNFGGSKGLTLDRVLIYPTKDMVSWIRNNDFALKNETRAKLYVGVTRARHSVGILIDFEVTDRFDDIEIYGSSPEPVGQ